MDLARPLAKQLGLIHNIAYYAPEVRDFAELGLPEFWRAYVAWRCAPLGPVGPQAATAALYNFAPRMVTDAVPSAWQQTDPAAVLALRTDCFDRAMRRGLGDMVHESLVAEAADLARRGIEGSASPGRVLFGAHADLEWPDEPHLALWHACTLWREHRGDGHNIALAAAEIDGLEAHVLLAARGIGNAKTIEQIRGWSAEEWASGVTRLAERGLVTTDGSKTDAGIEYRRSIERHTDALSAEPRTTLGDGGERLLALATMIADQLVSTGAVAARWPPPKPIVRGSR